MAEWAYNWPSNGHDLISECLLSSYQCCDPAQAIKLLDFFLISIASSQDLGEDFGLMALLRRSRMQAWHLGNVAATWHGAYL